MNRMRFLATVIGSLVATGLLAGGAGSQPAPPESTSVRVEKATSEGWSSQINSAGQYNFRIIGGEVATPASVDAVDVVLTVSFDYRTSKGDYGEIDANFRQLGDEGSEVFSLKPSSLGLVDSPSAKQRTSTTLMFIQRNVPGSGRTYEFTVDGAVRDGDLNGRALMSGGSASLVIDVRPAGD